MPENLLFDILLWLPVATLLRFKSVCKLCNDIISSSYFIARHLDHNCGKDNIIGFHDLVGDRFDATSYKFCLLSGNKYDDFYSFDCENFVKDPREPERFSSDGIVCIAHLYCDHQEVDLWNPAMKQQRRLPLSEQLRRLPSPYEPFEYDVIYGFGYSVSSDDYKVVRTFVHIRNANNNVVEVYSLRADSWRTIIEGALPFKFIRKPISRNGKCFWIGSNYTEEQDGEYYVRNDDSVVSFDLADETFGTMPLPENNSVYSVLDFLGDKLAFISGLQNLDPFFYGCRYYEIWVLHEYGGKESWSKIWNIGPTDIPNARQGYSPIGFSTNGDYLLLSTDSEERDGHLHSGEAYMYNLGTPENEYVQLRPHEEVYMFIRCMESLVSVKRAT